MNATKGVLLDIDGTLVDSNDAHARAYVDALEEYSYNVSFEQVRPLIGMGGDKLLPELLGVAGNSKLRKDIDARQGEIFKARYLPGIKAFPGVGELLGRFLQDGRNLIASSSAKEDEPTALLELANVDDLIGEQTSSSDAEGSKPDPDVREGRFRETCAPR